jgi:two-component system sensor histidine kinase TctE
MTPRAGARALFQTFTDTIRGRLQIYLLPPLIVVLAAGVYVDVETGSRPVRDAYDHALANAALAMAIQVRAEGPGSKLDDLGAGFAALLHPDSGSPIYYLVQGPQGRVLAGAPDLPTAPAAAGANPAYLAAEYRGRAIQVASYVSGSGADRITVSVAEDRAERGRATLRLLISEILMDLLQLIVTVALVWMGVLLALRPLLRLRAQIAARSPRELSPLDPLLAPGEIRLLVVELNRLFATLGEVSRSQQHFLANAAHQIRTPLAGLLIRLDLLMAETADPALRSELLALRTTAESLSHTAGQLLTLARAEPSSQLRDEVVRVDLGALVEAAVAQNVDRALAHGLDLGAEIEPAQVSGMAWLIQEVLLNLIDNAIRYVPAGGRITARCGLDGGRPFLEVEDDGPGIPAGEREAVRRRFYRMPHSPGDGCGLGLAIGEEVARLHGGALRIDDGQNGGVRVALVFPPLLPDPPDAPAAPPELAASLSK